MLDFPGQPEHHEPYSIEQFPALRGETHLVGYDANGEVMIEVRLATRRMSRELVERLQEWMQKEDARSPGLTGRVGLVRDEREPKRRRPKGK
jgi:hypothetical protein